MVKINIADIRQEYTKGGLRENELPGDPLSLSTGGYKEAIDAEIDEPTAVIVGTVSPEGKPSTRTVLLKGLHDGKFIFYTNYESRKGKTVGTESTYLALFCLARSRKTGTHRRNCNESPAGGIR